MNSSIRFFSEGISFILKEKRKIREWLVLVIKEEFMLPGDINYIFCGDDYLADLNKTYLDHNTFTDILTFPLPDKNVKISGDIFISIDRVKENSTSFDQPFETELKRVMVHGVLHLLGFKDKTRVEKECMTEKENYYLRKVACINVSRGT